MQSKMAFLVEEAPLTVEELQLIHIQRPHTHITGLVGENQNKTRLTNSLQSGGRSENMSKCCIHHHRQYTLAACISRPLTLSHL